MPAHGVRGRHRASTRPPSSSAVTAPASAASITEAGRFDWASGRFPRFTEPVTTYNGLQWFGQLRRVRLLHRAAIRATARRRRLPVAVQRVPAAPGARDSPHRDGCPRRQRPGRRSLARRRPPRVAWVAYADLPDSPYRDLAQQVPAAGCRAPSSPSGSNGGRELPARRSSRHSR